MFHIEVCLKTEEFRRMAFKVFVLAFGRIVCRGPRQTGLFSVYSFVPVPVFALGCTPRCCVPCSASSQQGAVHWKAFAAALWLVFRVVWRDHGRGSGKTINTGPIFDLSVKRTDCTGWNSLNLKVAFSANLPVLVICKSEKTPQLPETADSLVMCLPLLHRRFFPFQVLCTERKPCRRDLFCLVIVPAVSGRFGEPWRTGKKIIIFQA